MIKSFMILFLSSIYLLGCKKSADQINPGGTGRIEVVDYVSSQPIEGCEIWEIVGSNFDIRCLCFWSTSKKLIGYTNSNGVINNVFLFTTILVKKDNYYEASNKDNSYVELSPTKTKIHLFRKAQFSVTALPRQTYSAPLPYLEIRVMLSNGTMSENWRSITPIDLSAPFPAFGCTNMKNKIRVLRESSDPLHPEVLSETDVILSNNNLPITITY